MIELSKQSGNPVPHFEEVTDSVLVTIPLKESIKHNPIMPTPSITLSERQKLILDILKDGPLNRKDPSKNERSFRW